MSPRTTGITLLVYAALSGEEQGLSGARIGVEMAAVPAADFPALQAALEHCAILDATALIDRLRAHKSPGEIGLLRQAGAITETALAALVRALACGMAERGVKRGDHLVVVFNGVKTVDIQNFMNALWTNVRNGGVARCSGCHGATQAPLLMAP